MKLEELPYVSDILNQVPALRGALSRFDRAALEPIAAALRDGVFDRIILTGMGASFYALYPTWLYLSNADLPVMWVDSAELLHFTSRQVTPRSLIWVVSQSGRSAEIVALAALLKELKPACLIAVTNDLTSPLAETCSENNAQSALIPIDALPETTVSTRTYLNSLALCQLAARVLYGEDVAPSFAALEKAMDLMEAYLADWRMNLEMIADQVGQPRHLVITGRGSSIAAACCSALIMGEAGGSPAIGMPAGQFRHGPLEMCSPDLAVILFAGSPETRALNQRLAVDIQNANARIFWLGPDIAEIPALPMPFVEGIAQPLAEMLPMQLLSLHLAQQAGQVPGKFKYIGKVTLVE